MIARLGGVVLGIWLMVAPALLDYGDPARANDRIVGPVAGGLAFVSLWSVVRNLRWGILPLAGWLVIAPPTLTYDDPVTWLNSVLVGGAFMVVVLLGRGGSEAFWGGWPSLWGDLPSYRHADHVDRTEEQRSR